MDVTEKMDLSLLPELVLENVLYFMNGSNLIIANKVCRSWKELSSRALRDRVSSFILVPPYATKFLGSFIRDGTKALVFQEYDVDEKDLYDGSSSNKIRKRKSPESDSSEADSMRPSLKSDEILLDFIRNQMTSVPEICFIFAYGNDDADLTLSLSQLYHECGFSFSAVRVSCGFLFDSICEDYAPDCRSYSPYLDAESGINYAPRGGFSSLITSKHPSLYKTIMMDLGNPSRDESCFLDLNYPLKCLFIFKHGKQEEYGPIRENDLDRVSKELREYIYENGVEVVDFRSLHITYLDDQSSIIKRCENYLLVGFLGKSIQVAKSFLNQSDYTKQIDRGYQEIWIEWLECFRDCLDFNPDIYNCKTHTIGFIFAPCNLTGLIICAREIFPKVMFISAHAGSTLVKPFKNLNPDNFRDISEKVFYSTAVDREIAILLIHFTSGEQTLSSPTDESKE